MEIRQRAYRDPSDFEQISALMRAVSAHSPAWNAWSFARFDIWAARRLGDESVFHTTDWQSAIQLWHSADGGLLGAALLHRGMEGALISDPRAAQLAPRMLDWLETAYVAQSAYEKPLQIEVKQGNAGLWNLLMARGYELSSDYMMVRRRALTGALPDAPNLPPGLRMVNLDQDALLERFFASVNTVFHFQDCVEVYHLLQRLPCFVPELDLAVLNEQDEVVSFATLWVDWQNQTGEFEPVGTLPGYQRMGLASALMAELARRASLLGVTTLGVESWSESPGANRLYETAGMRAVDRIYSWSR